MRHRQSPRGFLMVDLLVALVMAIALLMAMTAAISALQRGEHNLALARSASRQLEMALWTLQTGGKPEGEVTVEPLPAPRANGQIWVRVSVAPQGGRGVRPTLVGLVPASSLPGGAP